jgi:hypothetical protein
VCGDGARGWRQSARSSTAFGNATLELGGWADRDQDDCMQVSAL